MAEFPDRDKVRAEMAGHVAIVFQRHRREAERLMGDPPDPSKLTPEFWDDVRRETGDILAEFMLYLVLRSAVLHGLPEIDATMHVAPWATHEAETAARQITETSREWVEAAAAETRSQAALVQGGENLRIQHIQTAVDRTFGPGRAANIARHESAQAMVQGGEIAIDVTGVQVTRIWRHSEFAPPGHAGSDENECEICTPMLDTESDEWGDLMPGSAHVLCDCFIEYIEVHTGRTIGGGATGKSIRMRSIVKYSDDQPRVPAGSPDGGEWGEGGIETRGPLLHDNAESIKAAKDESEKWINELDEDEKEAIQDYTLDSSINDRLREGIPNRHDDRTAGYIDDALEKIEITKQLVLYRGVGFKIKLGEKFSDDGFISASHSRETADEFAANNKRATVMELRIPKGFHAGYIAKLSPSYASEGEFLLPRGLEFHCVGEHDGVKIVIPKIPAIGGATGKSVRQRGIVKYSDDQPRVPAGSPDGGEFGEGGGRVAHPTNPIEQTEERVEETDAGKKIAVAPPMSAAQFDKLTPDFSKMDSKVASGIQGYADGDFSEMSGSMREGRPPRDTKFSSAKQIEQRIVGMKSAFDDPKSSHVLDKDISVFRVVKTMPFAVDKVGTIFTDKGFVSTTSSKSVAKGIGTGGNTSDRKIFTIRVPAGERIVVPAGAADPNKEITLRNSTKFRVVGIGKKGRMGQEIHLEVVR